MQNIRTISKNMFCWVKLWPGRETAEFSLMPKKKSRCQIIIISTTTIFWLIKNGASKWLRDISKMHPGIITNHFAVPAWYLGFWLIILDPDSHTIFSHRLFHGFHPWVQNRIRLSHFLCWCLSVSCNRLHFKIRLLRSSGLNQTSFTLHHKFSLFIDLTFVYAE